MVTDDSAESGQDAMDSTDQQLTSDLNVKFIEPPKWSREDCLREILQNILSHPAVLDHFLFPSRDVILNKPFGFSEDLGVCLTEGLCSILVEVKSSPEESVSRSLDGYFDKCVSLLSDKTYAKRTTLVLLHQFLQSTNTFITQEHVNKMLLILLSLSIKDLINIESKTLKEKGNILLVLLNNVNNRENAVVPALDLKKFQILFSLLALLDIVSIEQACLQVLACYPLATVAMPKSVFIQCLESDSAVRMEILSIVICQNVQARDWFESWIVEKKLADFNSCGLQLVLQYIDRCPERLAGSEWSFRNLFYLFYKPLLWFINNHSEITSCDTFLPYQFILFLLGKKVLLKILKIYKHCLNLLEKEIEVSLEGKEGSEISTWKPTTPFESMINLSLSLHQMKVLGSYHI